MECIDVMGIGFGCVDLVYLDEVKDYAEPVLMNGGTCLNVLTVLAQLGANVKMIMAGTKADAIYKQFLKNCNKLNVNILFMNNSNNSLPRCIQINSNNSHKYQQVCPFCNNRLKYATWGRSAKDVEEISGEPEASVLFIDRITMGIKKVIQQYYNRRKIIFFEPNSSRNISSIVGVSFFCDIVKFSSSKISKKKADQIVESSLNGNLKLVIVTKGRDGLDFKYRNTTNDSFSEWIEVKPNNIIKGGDSSGSGDWLTAGFINRFILMNGKTAIYSVDNIKKALDYAMGLSEIANLSIGAQGPFYDQKLIQQLRESYHIRLDKHLEKSSFKADSVLTGFCPLCGQILHKK